MIKLFFSIAPEVRYSETLRELFSLKMTIRKVILTNHFFRNNFAEII